MYPGFPAESEQGEDQPEEPTQVIGGVWNLCQVTRPVEIKSMFEGLEVRNEDQVFGEEDFPAPPVPGGCVGGSCKCRPRMGRIDRKKGVQFRFGDGSMDKMGNETWICGLESVGAEPAKTGAMKLEFQVADVRKPLFAVKRIAERGIM